MAKDLYADEIDYRGFTISPCQWEGYTFVSDDYDWAPDGQMGFAGCARTIQDCKEQIDQYYAENTVYVVPRSTDKSNTLTKFYFIQEAIEFCKNVGENTANIRMFFKGDEINFDSI